MKSLWIATISAAMASVAFASRQEVTTQPSISENLPNASIAAQLAGAELVAELSHPVEVKKAKLGDLVKATLTQDVLAHGRITIRRGSKLVGHVTEVRVRTKDNEESRLRIIFDKVLLKGGNEIDFTAAIRALAAPVRLSTMEQAEPMSASVAGVSNGSPGPQPVSSAGIGRNAAGTSTIPNAGSQSPQGAEIEPPSRAPSASANSVMGSGSRGVFGLPGLQLGSETGSEHATVITSTRQNVKLDSGTQIVIQINNLAR
jgi:hypothetical protein